jgi:hypothetical protein
MYDRGYAMKDSQIETKHNAEIEMQVQKKEMYENA